MDGYNSNYWKQRSSELQFCLDNNLPFNIGMEDYYQSIPFLNQQYNKLCNINQLASKISEEIPNLPINNIQYNPSQNTWEVKYEVYFNPHTQPPQLMDTKTFSNFLDAFQFLLQDFHSRL